MSQIHSNILKAKSAFEGKAENKNFTFLKIHRKKKKENEREKEEVNDY